MAYTPLVTVITIVYNGEKYIENTIQSVIDQTYRPIEYIVIDGGSTDNTLSIIKKYDHFITGWISEKDRGISDAFNKGLARAKGEIIGIINADDWYEKDTIEKVVQQISDHDIVYGDLRLWKNGKTNFILKGNDARLTHEMTINHPTVFVRKSCYEKLGLFSEQFRCAMDYELLLRHKVNGSSFHYIPNVLANMRWDGLSDTRWLLGCRETLVIKNKYLPNHRLQHALYFYKHVLAIALSKFLQKIQLGFLVRTWRTRFAKVKKVYE